MHDRLRAVSADPQLHPQVCLVHPNWDNADHGVCTPGMIAALKAHLVVMLLDPEGQPGLCGPVQ